jgi:hypothetical protein
MGCIIHKKAKTTGGQEIMKHFLTCNHCLDKVSKIKNLIRKIDLDTVKLGLKVVNIGSEKNE